MRQLRAPSDRKPRFNINDRVRIVGPTTGERTHHRGEVAEVIGAGAGTVLRYRATFPDGTSGTFFGFELELIQS